MQGQHVAVVDQVLEHLVMGLGNRSDPASVLAVLCPRSLAERIHGQVADDHLEVVEGDGRPTRPNADPQNTTRYYAPRSFFRSASLVAD